MNRKTINLLLILALVFCLPFGALANGPERDTSVSLPSPELVGKFDLSTPAKQTVIIEFHQEPLSVVRSSDHASAITLSAYEQELISTHDIFANNMKTKSLDVKVNHVYTEVFNGVSIEVPGDQIEDLLTLPGVKAIYPNMVYQVNPTPSTYSPQMDKSAPIIGVDEELHAEYDGTGVKVGILDTGVDYNHPWFTGKFDADYKGWDTIDQDQDPMETLPNDPNGEETNHGTHVAGTVSKIAPGATLYAYRVLGPNGSGTTETVIAGIEKALSDGMDVINLSLGNSVNDADYPTSTALNNAMDAGVVTVTSNGNSGPEDWTVGSPATALKGISVGASTPELEVTVISYDGAPSPIYAGIMTFSPDINDFVGTDQELVYIGEGLEGYDVVGEKDLEGKIALIQRGTISFVDKTINAQSRGAIASIIFNNEPGEFSGTLGEPGDYIPTMSISGVDGQLLLEELEADPDFSISFDTVVEKDLIADFSSRGPVMDNYVIKPDVVAPGVNITSSVPWYAVGNAEGDYEGAVAAFQGTSMAAPHVTGAVALLLEKYPDWSSYDVKVALMNNTIQLTDRHNERYRLIEQGAGRIDVKKAINTTVTAAVYEEALFEGELLNYYSGSISFGKVEEGTVTRTVYLNDVDGSQPEFELNVEWYKQPENNGATVTAEVYDEGTTVTTDVYNSFDVTLNVTDAIDGEYEGAIKVFNEQQEILIPFSFYVGNIIMPNPVESVSMVEDPEESWVLSNDKNSEYGYSLRTRADEVMVWIHDWLAGEPIGYLENHGLTEPGQYFGSIETYHTFDGEEVEIEDGDYSIVVDAYLNNELGQGLVYLTLDTTGPQIELDAGDDQSIRGKDVQLTGSIYDLMMEVGLDDPVSISYMIEDEDGVEVEWTELTFDAQRSFEIEHRLEYGEYELTFEGYDDLGNTSEKVAQITVRPPASGGGPGGGSPDDEDEKDSQENATPGPADQAEEALQDREVTTVTLKNGLTIRVPGNAVGLQNASVRVTQASEEETEEYLTELQLDKDLVPTGSYLDFQILDENEEALEEVTFEQPVELSIPIDAISTDNINPEKLNLYKIHDDGTVQFIGGRLIDGELVVLLNSFSRYIVMAKDQSFTDVNERNYPWAVNEIEVLASKNIITGKTETGFAPQDHVTRAEFTALLVRTLGLTAEDTSTVNFQDVNEESWYYEAVQTAVSHDLINGYNETTFAPNQNITRAEMAVITSRALDKLGIQAGTKEVLTNFTDQSSFQDWAQEGIAAVVEAGIMQGKSADRFVAQELTSRAEAAVVIYRIYQEMNVR